MSSKLTKHNRIKKIGHQIHRKHYITPNNLSLDLADWWNRNNHKKDTSSRGVTTFLPRVYLSMLGLKLNHVSKRATGNCYPTIDMPDSYIFWCWTPSSILGHYWAQFWLHSFIERMDMKILTIAVTLVVFITGCIGSTVARHKYMMDSPLTQLYCTPVEMLESSLACARVVLRNASYLYGFVLSRGICYRCRTTDLSWSLSPEETLLTGSPLVLGMYVRTRQHWT